MKDVSSLALHTLMVLDCDNLFGSSGVSASDDGEMTRKSNTKELRRYLEQIQHIQARCSDSSPRSKFYDIHDVCNIYHCHGIAWASHQLGL